MIDKIHQSTIQTILSLFDEYGVKNVKGIYNPDISVVNEYIKKYEYRQVGGVKNFIENITEKGKLSHTVLFYKYSPIKMPSDVMNHNRNLSMFFNKIKTSSELNKSGMNRDLGKDSSAYQLRDMFFAEINYECEIITNSIDIMNYLQVLYLAKLKRNPKFSVTINIPEYGEPIEIESLLSEFSEINEAGAMDYLSYGNIFHLSFDFRVIMPIISDYYEKVDAIQNIQIKFDIK